MQIQKLIQAASIKILYPYFKILKVRYLLLTIVKSKKSQIM